MREDFVEVYKDFLDKYGMWSQCMQCIEEMSELTKELCKLNRYKDVLDKADMMVAIREEIADVLNMVEQLQYIFGAEEIDNIRLQKINNSKKLYLD